MNSDGYCDVLAKTGCKKTATASQAVASSDLQLIRHCTLKNYPLQMSAALQKPYQFIRLLSVTQKVPSDKRKLLSMSLNPK